MPERLCIQRWFPSILAKILPPSTMGFGRTGTVVALLNWLDVSFIAEMERLSEAKSDLKFLRINAIKFGGEMQ
ncbi:MAG: hypothetical protein OEY18_11510 [Candidatus Aminicenantes bacterium]|nr:hypothetical protein [Candidatus Aminicenantes bacterium]MDH5743869.1 hypothetical protein [Candidatus Aminicenantes bacterium]